MPRIRLSYYSLFFALAIAAVPTFAQKAFDQIDWSKVPHKKIQKLVEEQQSIGRNFINDLQPTCYRKEDKTGFRMHLKTYRIKMGLEELWSAYLSAEPGESWNSKIVSFAMLYNPANDSIYYAKDVIGSLQESQMIFLNLRIWGIANVAVAHQIKRIDHDNKHIEFCYLDCGKSEGIQEVYLKSIDSEWTEVSHVSRFRSDSKFRDKNLYPHFHEKAIDQFHENIEQWAKKQKPTLHKN
ncbi:MAG: hypothetical protein AAF990_11885 [Bacteroidota bacterium]